ncbi:serine/threonine-protein kinase [Microcella daejeonensis]|uniref:non-specific serine/threonine protein kinase n=1 Tax=Microcella daejeonensis TaxID=2994971 RepID=A0A9E8MLK2_9MICO|nr:serine/threonine-protein kinase [Microcella daejeonensis]WAB80986.1 serine/threonine-protein kinase [Microcella daejeonensis]
MHQTSNDGATTDGATTDGRIGALVAGRYRIDRLIGRGGMSTVYEAADQNIPRRVALKVFRPELTDDDDMRRHEGEVGMLASLNHPGLVTLFDAVADDDGSAVLVLELVTGGDMRTAMDAGPLSSSEVAVIGAAVADALSYSHDRGIVHRDVKPGNILVPERESADTGARAKLADFGIARLIDETRMTATGSVLGTAHYLSPEQAVGGAVGPASDVYSLGLVLLEALTGERAFPGSGVESAAARLARDPLLPARLDPAWAELLRGMTAREQDARLTAREAAERLRAVAAIPALPPARDEGLDPTLRLPVAAPSTGADLPTAAMGAAGADPETAQHADRSSPTAATVALSSALPAPPPPAPGSRPARPEATTPSQSDSTAPRTADRPETGAMTALRRHPVVAIGGIAASLLVVGIALAALFGTTTGSAARVDADTPPEYAVVDGTLGEHLEQLQRSVEP